MQSTNEELKKFMLDSGVQGRYLLPTRSELNFDRLYEIAVNGSLLLNGEVGVGKTQLTVDILAKLAEEFKAKGQNSDWEGDEFVTTDYEYYDPKLFVFYGVPRLLIKIRGFFDNNASLDEFLNELSKYKYLVLDDLGAEKPSDWVLETLYVIINDRYESMKQVLITSNKTIPELAETIGDRIASRLAEMCHIETIKGDDLRLK